MRQHIPAALTYPALLFLLIALLFQAGTAPARAAGTLTVLNTNDSGAGSLRQAIADAAPGDTIIFDSSLSGATIRLQSTAMTDSLIVDKTLTIDGSALATKLSISGDSDNNGSGDIRVLVVDAAVTLKSLIITKGNIAAAGGGILVSDTGALTLIGCTISENTSSADKGGGIIAYGALTIADSAISNNQSDQQGAGIAAFGGALTITGTTISGNTAAFGDGGGIWIGPANTDAISIAESSIANNTALGSGGGIYNDSASKPSITSSTISGNIATGAKGGGIYGNVTLVGSTVSDNTAPASSGAGLYTSDSSITNSSITNNIAFGDAGGIYVTDNGTATISGSTLAGNQAGSGSYGGAILNRPGSSATVTNSTFSGNSAGYAGGIENMAGATLSLSSVTMSGNQSPNVGGFGGLVNLGVLNIVNTIIANSTNGNCSNITTGSIPINVANLVQDGSCNTPPAGDTMLGALADNGGPTKTHALLAGSPAIDQGDAAYCDASADANDLDQRGYGRPVDGDDVSGAVCDIGAYEFSASKPNISPTLDQPANLTILEDAGLQTIGLSGIGAGAGESQALTISASSSNIGLVPAPLVSYTSPSATGSLSFTPAANANGTATIAVTVHDNGGTAGHGVDTLVRSITVQVSAVNDAPSFTAGPNQQVGVSAGPQTVSGWASGFSAGPANEASQTLLGYSMVSNSAPGLFSSAPAINTSGTLSYTPKAGARGVATIGVAARDSGGTANGGIDTSAVRTFTIAIGQSYDLYLPAIMR